MPYKSEVASRDFVNHGALQNRKIAIAHPNGKIQVFTFAVPPPEAQRTRAGTEVAEKFFEKVRSSLDGQGKCVKIFQGNGGEYRVFTSAVAPKQPERI